MTAKGKRDRSIFDAVSYLDSQDAQAEKRKRLQTKQDELRKAAATSQTTLYGSLMECRILLQRAMQHADATNGDAVDKCNDLLVGLLQARQQFTAKESKLDADNEDNRNDSVDYDALVKSDDRNPLHRQLELEYESCREQWKEVFNRRHKDVRLHAGLTAKAQFRVMDASFWQQIDATVEHEKLRKSDSENDYLFDDGKVYQHMLQDFVQAANRPDTQLAQERLKQVQSKSSKKVVDRKASKGRRIRYHEIPKLVNFTFPLSRPPSQTVLDENEWFSSLFGGSFTKK